VFIDLLQVFDYKRYILQANKPVKMCSMEPVISQFILLSPCLSNLDNVMFYFVYSFFLLLIYRYFHSYQKWIADHCRWRLSLSFSIFKFFFKIKSLPCTLSHIIVLGVFQKSNYILFWMQQRVWVALVNSWTRP
jgi:hypothetical protein